MNTLMAKLFKFNLLSPFKGEHRNRNIHLSILIIVFLLIALFNFPYHTWYTGWDNLHPEFNFGWNIKKAIQAVWQYHQGTGTYGGHGYAATLPHTIILWIMSLIIPDMYLRSSFTFLTLLIGAVGIFFLIRKILYKTNEDLKNKGALFGGLFYMLNYGTVQNYYIQLEAFIFHFASLPWLFYTLINYLENKSKKNLLIFALVSLISTTQGFIPPLFFVYMMLLGIFLFFYVVCGSKNDNKEDITVGGTLERDPDSAQSSSTGGKGQAGQNLPLLINRIKSSILIVVLTIFINAYWFFPVMYFSFSNSKTYLNAYNNLSSTEDFILKNKKYGDIKDVAILKGFIFDTIDTDDGSVFPIFETWQKHLKNPLVATIGYGSFLLICLGLIELIKKRQKFYTMGLAGGLVLSFSLLATNTFPFTLVSDLFQAIPITKQAFRVAFTKFSISLSFFYAIAFGLGIYALLYFCNRYKHKFILLGMSSILFIALMFFALPIFQGKFLYQRTKLVIPSAYFQVFDYFKHIPADQKIANMPQGWHWGWTDYKWGYSGSGFLWYGIEQPIMDRAYDSWGQYNEDYYWQLSYAIFSEKFALIDPIMDKYHISWIMFDKNVLPYPNVKSFLYSDKLEQYLQSSKKYTLVKTFHSEDIKSNDIVLYKVNLKNSSSQETISLDSIKNIGPAYTFTNYDRAYLDNGTYYTDQNTPFDIYYPFRSLFSLRNPNENTYSIVSNDQSLVVQSTIPNYLAQSDAYIATDSALIKAHLSGSLFEASLSASLVNTVYDSSKDFYFLNHQANNCVDKPGSSENYKQYTADMSLQFESSNSDNCYTIVLGDLSQRNSYLIQVTNKHTSGKQLQLALINQDSRKADVEVPLTNENNYVTQNIIAPPMKQYGLGYNLNFNNVSIGKEATENDIQHIKISTFPYLTLSSIKLTNPEPQAKTGNLYIFYQSYNKDWKAYEIQNDLGRYFPFIFGKELKNHVIVNNWANGWKLDGDQTSIVIIFWPQYFEYLGFVLIMGTLSIIGFKIVKRKT